VSNRAPNMALQRTRRARVPKQRTGLVGGRPVEVLVGTGGSPLNAQPLDSRREALG
jgi:hypothetical protein